jgi:hypothetical protein
MREFGSELGDRDAIQWEDGVRLAAGIQRAWTGRVNELAALGAPTRRLESLRADVGRDDALVAAWARLVALALPDSIIHDPSFIVYQ